MVLFGAIICTANSRIQVQHAYTNTKRMDVLRASHCNIHSLLCKIHHPTHPEVFCLALIGVLLFGISAYRVLSENAMISFKNILTFCFTAHWNGAGEQGLNDLVTALNAVLETLENDNLELFEEQAGRGSLLLAQIENM
ncbi:hypothetical protein HDU98_003697 [Podochytrium sp. JEL0797]|nr:hypothetical protein HDU98_003697 [Podochytrium sp. JEL0797]